MLRLVLLVLLMSAAVPPAFAACNDPSCGLNVTQLVQSWGYPCEDHTATTPDGYILSIQHISPKIKGAPVFFLMHGLVDCSVTWVVNLPSEGLGYILHDSGFDVWMGNSRGNIYSNSAIHLSPNSRQFWNFTWDDMASNDLPTFINYVLGQTGASQLYWVGHSQGTLQVFSGLSVNTDLQSKIRVFFALAPVAYLANITAEPLKRAADEHLDVLIYDSGVNQALPHTQYYDTTATDTCNETPEKCTSFLCDTMGCDPNNWNQTRYQVYLQFDPAGTSTKNIVHFGQAIRNGTFQMFDYGPAGNQQHYKSSVPPQYQLNKLHLPIALFSGGQDALADPADVAKLISLLPPASILNHTFISYYSHLDFIWGLDAHTVLYPKIVQLAKENPIK